MKTKSSGFITAFLWLTIFCFYACKTTKNTTPFHNFTYQPKPAKTLTAQYVQCNCKEMPIRMHYTFLSALILELYSDSSFTLAGSFGSHTYVHYCVLGRLSGKYTIENEKLLLNLQRRQMIQYPLNSPIIGEYYAQLMNFEELDKLGRIIFHLDTAKNQVSFCPLWQEIHYERPDTDCVSNSGYVYLQPVDWLPKPFLLGNNFIDIEFIYDVTWYCRQKYPIFNYDRYGDKIPLKEYPLYKPLR